MLEELLNTTNAERLYDQIWRKIRVRSVHPGLNTHRIRLAGLPAKAIYDLERNGYDILSRVRADLYEATCIGREWRSIRLRKRIRRNKLEKHLRVSSIAG